MSENPFAYVVTDADIEEISNSLDETCGMLIKDSELKHWIAEHVRRDRLARANIAPVKPVNPVKPVIDKALTIYNSKADSSGNRYWAFSFQDLITGKSVEGTISGGESNIKAVTLGWSEKDEWDRTIKIDCQELGIRQFNRMTKTWPYAGCHPDAIRIFIKKGLDMD